VSHSKMYPTNPTWRTAHILKKKEKSLYLSNYLNKFDYLSITGGALAQPYVNSQLV